MGSANENIGEKEGDHPSCNYTNRDECSNAKYSAGSSSEKDATIEKDEAELGKAQRQWLYYEEDVFDLTQL